MAADGLHEGSALLHRERERLLGIDILAGLTSVDAGQHPLEVARGHDHGVDVLAVEESAVVLHDIKRPALVRRRIRFSAGQAAVGQGDELGVSGKLVEEQAAPVADADGGHADAIAAGACRRSADDGCDADRSRRGDKGSPPEPCRRTAALLLPRRPLIRP